MMEHTTDSKTSPKIIITNKILEEKNKENNHTFKLYENILPILDLNVHNIKLSDILFSKMYFHPAIFWEIIKQFNNFEKTTLYQFEYINQYIKKFIVPEIMYIYKIEEFSISLRFQCIILVSCGEKKYNETISSKSQLPILHKTISLTNNSLLSALRKNT